MLDNWEEFEQSQIQKAKKEEARKAERLRIIVEEAQNESNATGVSVVIVLFLLLILISKFLLNSNKHNKPYQVGKVMVSMYNDLLEGRSKQNLFFCFSKSNPTLENPICAPDNLVSGNGILSDYNTIIWYYSDGGFSNGSILKVQNFSESGIAFISGSPSNFNQSFSKGSWFVIVPETFKSKSSYKVSEIKGEMVIQQAN